MCSSYPLSANWCNNSMFLDVDKAVITSGVFCTWEMEKVGTFLTFLLLLRTDICGKRALPVLNQCLQ
ncbi:hypothetical protein GRJ2_001633100 [Grus japonensis]|uniref:Uncharacterized protein n=1 Tax=Grus japonensis TaxID=30415 RepID=A0ABC9X1W2_GRUJA